MAFSPQAVSRKDKHHEALFLATNPKPTRAPRPKFRPRLEQPLPSFAGGAIYNAGTLKVSSSTLSNNAAGDVYAGRGGNGGNGGAISNADTLTVNTNSTLSDNTAYGSGYGAVFGTGIGGAIDNAGSLSVSGSITSDNAAYFGGGVFSGYKLTATIAASTLSNNSAYDGGAVWNDGTMTLSGCYVDANTATDAGGGIYNGKEGHLTVQSTTRVAGNSSPVGSELDNLGSVKLSKASTVG